MNKKYMTVLFMLFYYICLFVFYLYNPHGSTLAGMSDYFLCLFLIIMPFVLIVLPFVFKCLLRKRWRISIFYSLFLLLIYMMITMIAGYFTDDYFKTFSSDKWENSNYCDLRYMMVEDLKNKYSFIGMTKGQLYGILGETGNKNCPYDYEKGNKSCYIILNDELRNTFLCFYYNQYDHVIRIDSEVIN